MVVMTKSFPYNDYDAADRIQWYDYGGLYDLPAVTIIHTIATGIDVTLGRHFSTRSEHYRYETVTIRKIYCGKRKGGR